jgi:chorismate-pyruvate lyase
VTSLHVSGHVLLDSLAYIAVEALPPPLVQELRGGIRPIGHVLANVWTRRTLRDQDARLLEELWGAVGNPDLPASRSLCIYTPRAPCILLAETFRRGILTRMR